MIMCSKIRFSWFKECILSQAYSECAQMLYILYMLNTSRKQVPPGTPVVNALSKQRAMLENILRACVGLAPENNMILEYKWKSLQVEV